MFTVRFVYEERDYNLNILRIAREHCLPQKKHEKKEGIKHFSLHFIQDGYGTLIVNGKSVFLNKGNVFLLSPDGDYEYYPDPLTPWTYYWIDVNGDGTDELFGYCGFTKEKPYLFLGSDTSKIAEIFEHMADGYGGGETQTLANAGYTILLFSELIRKFNKMRFVDVQDTARFKMFRDVLIFIDNNHRLSFTLDNICETMNLTKTQLISMFNDFAGMTPISYINRYRISLACVFLTETELDIKSIASMTGFDDVKYFARVFAKWKNMSPRDYRKNGKGENPYLWLKEKNIDFR